MFEWLYLAVLHLKKNCFWRRPKIKLWSENFTSLCQNDFLSIFIVLCADRKRLIGKLIFFVYTPVYFSIVNVTLQWGGIGNTMAFLTYTACDMYLDVRRAILDMRRKNFKFLLWYLWNRLKSVSDQWQTVNDSFYPSNSLQKMFTNFTKGVNFTKNL